MRKPIVFILGCGPSGLLAAHACELRDVPFIILSRKVKSRIGGAQFSHIPILGYDDEDFPEVKLTYQVRGDIDGYADKVYGDTPVPFVSVENVFDGKVVPAWSLRKLYDALWDRFSDRITDVTIDPYLASSLDHTMWSPYIFSSVPLPTICMAPVDMNIIHSFRYQTIRIFNEALDPSLPDNTILYDGTDEHSYYRMSRIFGVGSTEWSANAPIPPLSDLRTIDKPVDTNCNCHSRITRIGRFGTYKKGILTYHAFNTVTQTLEEAGM